MNGQTCSTCKFWQHKPWPNNPVFARLLDQGDCRRRAPVTTGWPRTQPTDWCGKHEDRLEGSDPRRAAEETHDERHKAERAFMDVDPSGGQTPGAERPAYDQEGASR